MTQSHTNRLLGYPPDARLLILNADDFGMCHAVNEAIQRVLRYGLVRSTTLMVPCPWALHAMHFLSENPHLPFGIHLTAISDPQFYRWGPVAAREQVRSLIDPAGYFYDFEGMSTLLARADIAELETEFRAQIESVLAAGLRPTHLDWHSLRFGARADIPQLITRLAMEYRLALRVIGRSWIDMVQSQGLPTIDYDFLDSYGIDPAQKAHRYAQLLRELPEGLSEWAVHPGLDSPELLALEPTARHERQSDLDFWTSEQAREIVQAQGITLIDYRPLQEAWSDR